MFVVCDNSLGVGDDSGRYVDVAPVNAAFLDRFAYREEIKFLDPADEAVMISRRTGLALDAVTPMIAYASLTRENARSGKLTLGLTPRRLLAWARAVVARSCAARSRAYAFRPWRDVSARARRERLKAYGAAQSCAAPVILNPKGNL